jgi:hypothetical protein
MSNNVGIAITAGAAGGFALLGVVASNILGGNRERRIGRAEAALELANTEPLIWDADWVELRTELRRQETRLAVAGVPEDLVDAFRRITEACWRDARDSDEQSAGQEKGIATRLLEAREQVHRAVRAYLLREKTWVGRRKLSADAIAVVHGL